jgi:hypothetical protein
VPDPQDPVRTSICPFQIVAIVSGETKAIVGVDTVQALTLALHVLPDELSAIEPQENGILFRHEMNTWVSALLARFIWIQLPIRGRDILSRVCLSVL